MTRTDKKVRYSPKSKYHPENEETTQAIEAVEGYVKSAEVSLKILEGRWKLVILFHLFHRPILRFSELERAIPGISQKMLIQQLRSLESDDIVQRIVHPQVPPKVEYTLTELGKALCPSLDALLTWAAIREKHQAAKLAHSDLNSQA